MGYRLNLRWGFSVQSPFLSNFASRPSSFSIRGVEPSIELVKASSPPVITGQSDSLCNDILKARSAATSGNDYVETEEIEMTGVEDRVTLLTSLQAYNASHYRLLMENLHTLEVMIADSEVVRLERDVLVQLERLGALKLFNTCLSRTHKPPNSFDLPGTPTEHIEKHELNDLVNDHNQKAKTVVPSQKKKRRRSSRERASGEENKVHDQELSSKMKYINSQVLKISYTRRLNVKRRQHKIKRNEAELARGVKLVADLERIRILLERETGQAVSFSSWAEAAGVDKKVLREKLHLGWYCRDELIRSSRPLVMYVARNYRGLGVAFEDLIQAGNFGVLQGAQRFDHSKGYKFSTYVLYWIRKSILTLTVQHARGIRVPSTLNKAINQIQKARKILSNSHGKYPDDIEIAEFTGLSLAKIASARKCLRVVGSVDQKIGHYVDAKFMEVTPDTSIKCPNRIFLRQQMMRDLYKLITGLNPREMKVLVLRFGLGNHQCKSLEEIGKLFNVSKERIRKIEKTALTKLRNVDNLHDLNHYMYM